jgi:hypothetical protein
MRELEGRPIGEIAGILSVSASAVETLLFRGRRSVREQLEGSLTCAQAEQAISRQLDGSLSRTEKSQLRGHLRQCEPCAQLARSLRAQRRAIRSLGVLPLPAALAWSEFGTGAAVSGLAAAGSGAAASGGAWLAGSLAAKLAAATLVGAVVAGAGYEAAVNHPWTSARVTTVPHAGAHVAGAPSAGSRQATPAAASQLTPVRLGHHSRAVARRSAVNGHRRRLKRGRPRQHTAPPSTPISPPGDSHAATHPPTTVGLRQSHGPKTTSTPKSQPSVHPVNPPHASKPIPRLHPSTPAHSPPKQIGAGQPAHPPKAKPNPPPPKPKPHPARSAPASTSNGDSGKAQKANQK